MASAFTALPSGPHQLVSSGTATGKRRLLRRSTFAPSELVGRLPLVTRASPKGTVKSLVTPTRLGRRLRKRYCTKGQYGNSLDLRVHSGAEREQEIAVLH